LKDGSISLAKESLPVVRHGNVDGGIRDSIQCLR
jgi:hypothetical protein